MVLAPVEKTKFNHLKKQIVAYKDDNEYLSVDLMESFSAKLNKFVSDNGIAIELFEFEALHYSLSLKTINQRGLKAIFNYIELVEELVEQKSIHTDGAEKMLQQKEKIFIVHGRDEHARLEAEILIRRIGLEPIILSLMPNRGETIMEKFIRNSDVRYALVLLTPDDVGALNDSISTLEPRARQNVVFELGYFYGKLGRENVCCTMKSNVEVPSDINGVVYIPYKNSLTEIQLELYKEFNAAGLDFKLFD